MTEAAPPEKPVDTNEATPATMRERLVALGGRLQKYQRFLPLLSFASGIVSALLMKRGFERIYWLLGALFITWLVIGVLFVLGRQLASNNNKLFGRMHFGAIVLAQSASQEVLFFVLPFYFWSSSLFSPNVVFFLLLCAVILATLIDPIFERITAWTPGAMALLSFSNFTALNFSLPVLLGLPNGLSLHLSVVLSVLLLVLFAGYFRQEERG